LAETVLVVMGTLIVVASVELNATDPPLGPALTEEVSRT
jgi:hypothetical protein